MQGRGRFLKVLRGGVVRLATLTLVLLLSATEYEPGQGWRTRGRGRPFVEAKVPSRPRCVSKGEWPKFDLHGKPPKNRKELSYCSRWKEYTCCDEEQTAKARSLAATMDYRTTTKECRTVWQVLQCAVCSPDIGVLNNTALEQEDDRVPVCLRYCESVFNECATSQFAGDEFNAIRGCHPNKDVVCSPLEDWGIGPKAFCELAGFRVVGNDEEEKCYDGEETAELQKPSRKKRRKEEKESETSVASVEDLLAIGAHAVGMLSLGGFLFWLYTRSGKSRIWKRGDFNKSRLVKKLQQEQNKSK